MATSLTASYVATPAISVTQANWVKFILTIVEGTATSVEIRVQSTNDGTNWINRTSVGAPTAAGVSSASPHVISFDDMTLIDTTPNDILVYAGADDQLRLLVKRTGGDAVTPLKVDAVRGRES